MCSDRIITAGVVVIGNEILSGRTQDANLAYLAKALSALSIRLEQACFIPDQENIIIQTVKIYKATYTYVFTTGGIGPTHDDITSLSIAKLFNVSLLLNDKAVLKLQKHYNSQDLNESRLRMAKIPEGAELIDNPVSAAPGFKIDNVYVLAGVPIIMQAMFENIKHHLVSGDKIFSITLVANLGETSFADRLTSIQKQYPVVEIGSYPFFKRGFFGTSLVLRSTNLSELKKAREEIQEYIISLGGEIKEE
ncbi:MAG: competence/damage-inducible protein A [Alphaproteobacteria bacterium]|nr:competence/damage-inducible protein A [Alphaproteobacteria bacterium]